MRCFSLSRVVFCVARPRACCSSPGEMYAADPAYGSFLPPSGGSFVASPGQYYQSAPTQPGSYPGYGYSPYSGAYNGTMVPPAATGQAIASYASPAYSPSTYGAPAPRTGSFTYNTGGSFTYPSTTDPYAGGYSGYGASYVAPPSYGAGSYNAASVYGAGAQFGGGGAYGSAYMQPPIQSGSFTSTPQFQFYPEVANTGNQVYDIGAGGAASGSGIGAGGMGCGAGHQSGCGGPPPSSNDNYTGPPQPPHNTLPPGVGGPPGKNSGAPGSKPAGGGKSSGAGSKGKLASKKKKKSCLCC